MTTPAVSLETGYGFPSIVSAQLNFLAHLHIAERCQSHALGNLLGDFVKGPDLDAYPANVQQGIRLHRYVDATTDRHPALTSLRQLFPPDLKRYAPICLDLFWDHILGEHWERYHAVPLHRFTQVKYQELHQQILELDPRLPSTLRVSSLVARMTAQDWLTHYTDIEVVSLALERIGQRLKKPVALQASVPVLRRHHAALIETFDLFYPELISRASYWSAS